MKLVIDIPEHDYIRIKNYYEIHETMEAGFYYIANGTPLTESDDCVSRKVLETTLFAYIHRILLCENKDNIYATLGELLEYVDNHMPSVQPKRDKGEWIAYHLGAKWICSQCNEKNDSRDNFCPNCGADMRGEK